MDKIALLKSMLEQDAENSKLLYLLALEYSSAGDDSNAAEYYKAALKGADLQLSKEILESMSHMPGKNELPKPTVNEHNEDTPEPVPQSAPRLSVIDGNKVVPLPVDETRKTILFSDIGGLDTVKKSIRSKIINPFLSPGLYSQFKKRSGGGILLYGPPGCGKTFIAKAIAGECRAKFTSVQITDILSMWLGASAQNVHNIFSTARASKPCVLFFDEIDTLGYNRSKTNSDAMRSVIDQLLAELDGFDSDTRGLLIVGATNMPWDVDQALRRPGRFDKTIFVPPPDDKAREVIFELKLRSRPCGKIDFMKLASMTNLYSGADIENCVEIAAETVLERIVESGDESLVIEQRDLENAIQSCRSSTTEWLKMISNYVKYSNSNGFYDEVDEYLRENRRYL